MKIGMCFPEYDYKHIDFNDFKKYIIELNNIGVNNFDFYSSFICDYKNDIDNLFEFLNSLDIKVSFHFNGYQNLETYKFHISTVRNRMRAANMDYETTMVFHAPNYEHESSKYSHIRTVVNDFDELSEFAYSFKILVLVETLSKTFPSGNHIGDDIDELEVLANSIENPNFGFCWDIGHTSHDSDNNLQDELLTNKIINKTKFTHIHGYNEKIDHLPLINPDLVEGEVKLLIRNNYKGVFSLEHEVKNLKENIEVYKTSIKNLKKLLEV